MSRLLGGAAIGEEVQAERGPHGPVQFWRGSSRYVVGEVLDTWVETAPWWERDTSGAHRVDEHRIAELLGVPAVTPAQPDFVRRHTGQPIGGVAPLGHPEPIGTLVDVELARYPEVWAAAGHPSAVFPTSYEELLRLTDGAPAEVREGPRSTADIGLAAESAS